MEEKFLRFKVFKDSLNHIDERNKKVNNYRLGLNEFADLSHEEFEHNDLGLKKELPKRRGSSEEFSCIDVVDFPKSVDWRKEGAATSVKNQGSCGCCWAFSTVASVEGINQIVKGNLTSLSDSLLIVTHHSTMDEMEGVFDDECETYLNHGVAAVGYGTTKRSDYIIVKNSRGPKRGKRGYIRLKRNTGKPEGLCGTNKMASFPTKKSSDFQTHFI